jgi:hypothetical protein
MTTFAQQVVVTTPVGSGQGDPANVGFNKINTNFAALFSGTPTIPVGADPTGVADSTTALNALFATPGPVVLPYGTYSHSGTLTLASYCRVQGNGSTLSYTGAGTQVQTATTGFTIDAALLNVKLNPGSGTIALQLNSAFNCQIDVEYVGASQTNTICDMEGNTTGATNPNANHNSVFNWVKVRNNGTCGRLLRLHGASSSDGLVTDNWFDVSDGGSPNGHYIVGIDFSQWCDSNTFVTKPLLVPLGTAAVCVVANSSSPTGDSGVYWCVFEAGMAIDCFGSPGGDARQGVQQNYSYAMDFGQIECSPVPVNGIFSANGNAQGGEWGQTISASSAFRYKNFGGTYVGIGYGQNTAYSLYTTQFTLSGANPASAVFADTFPSTATGTTSGVTVANATAAVSFTVGSYNAFSVTNLNLGAGSSVTYQTGLYIPDMTSGSTANYGIASHVSSGSNKYNLYVPGTASNYLAGPLSVNGASPPAQVTGWGTPTGPSVQNNFSGSAATLVQCSAAIAQIIHDLKAFGLYGA